MAGFAWNDHAPVRDKFKHETTRFAFLRDVWRSCTEVNGGASLVLQRMKNGADMIRCGVFLQQLIKKMHRMHHFVMLFVDMLLRKAE